MAQRGHLPHRRRPWWRGPRTTASEKISRRFSENPAKLAQTLAVLEAIQAAFRRLASAPTWSRGGRRDSRGPSWPAAGRRGRTGGNLLPLVIIRQNRTQQRRTNPIPLDVWDQARLDNHGRIRPTPGPSLLDLHFSMGSTRRVYNDQTIEVEGRNDEIATTSRKSVTIVGHPGRKFWDLNHPPKDVWPPISATFDI